MDEIEINLECEKHSQKKVEFFCYDPKTADCTFICSRCVPTIPKQMVIIDLEQAFSDEQNYVHNWPPLKDQDLHQKIEDAIQQKIETPTQGIPLDNLQQFYLEFEEFLQKLQDLNQNEENGGPSNFYNDYKNLAKVEQLKSYLQVELEKDQKFDQLSNEFLDFLKYIKQDSSLEIQLQSKLNQVEKKIEKNPFGELEESFRILIQDYQKLADNQNNLQQLEKYEKIKKNQNSKNTKKVSKNVITYDPSQLGKDVKSQIIKNKKAARSSHKVIKLDQYKQEFVDYINLNFRYKKFQNIQADFQFYDHPFQLAFRDQKDNQNETICDQCQSPTFNYYWKCNTDSKLTICVDCGYQVPEYQSYFESLGKCCIQIEQHRHQLQFQKHNEFNEQQCNICERLLLRFSFSCQPCNFFVCQTCTSTNKEVKTEKSYTNNIKRNNFDFFVQKGREIYIEQEEIIS
ncbi:hypothetical protein ABPG74_016005 [Tetrahymena malaccensis]